MKTGHAVAVWYNSAKGKIEKRDVIVVAALTLFILLLLIISPLLPDERPEAIRRELSRQGYNVERMDFQFVKDRHGYRGWIFQSSEPLYYNGHLVSQWAVSRHQRGFAFPHFHYIYCVMPYPPLPETVSINITFTAEEIERISEFADGQPIERFLRQVIRDSALAN
ncbi:MAG: hypothetical protein FWE19_05610 [Oscillospiraceae bacterium]|nr:hypothetical protein [Oscillospiraceae bacterium]